MAYSTGMLDKRVGILTRAETTDGTWGRQGGLWSVTKTVWASVTWSKGVKAMREGALDAYDTIMVRMRWHDYVTRDVRLKVGTKVYQIESLNGDKTANEMQITAVEIVQ